MVTDSGMASLASVLERLTPEGQNPPDLQEIAAWMEDGQCPADVLQEANRRLTAMLINVSSRNRGATITGIDTDLQCLDVRFDPPSGAATAAEDELVTEYLSPVVSDSAPRPVSVTVKYKLAALADTWDDMEEGSRPGFPLAPIVRAWYGRPLPITPDRRDKAILPATFAVRTARRDRAWDYLPGFTPPPRPGPVDMPPDTDYLPGLEPDVQPTPAMLLTIFDAAGGESLTKSGPATIEARIFVEALTGVPRQQRDGHLHETRYTIGDIAGEWLQWRLKNYRPTGKLTGTALRRALGRINRMEVPVGQRGGWYIPLIVAAGSGNTLNDMVSFMSRLPPGDVGPPVDRRMLRMLGKKSGKAYRAYLSAVFDWDTYGGRNGRLTLPTRPVVDRAPGGQVLNARGEILTRYGKPVYTPHDSRAIQTGERELNPYRTRYPDYNADNLVVLVFGPRRFEAIRKESDTLRRYRSLARQALVDMAALGGCTIERLGGNERNGFLPWRIMPPDASWEALAPPPGRLIMDP